MSGLIGGVLSGVGIAGSINHILFGDGGPVVLGDVVFQQMEVPAKIEWGGKQALKVHKFPGGGRVIDAMGRDDKPVEWSGKMYSPGADARAKQLDQMRIDGVPVTLQWGNHLLTVVIEEFHGTDRAWGTDYRIRCEVLRDENGGDDDSSPSLLSQLADDAQQALAIYGQVSGLFALGEAVIGSLSSVQSAVQVQSDLTAGTSDAVAIAALTVVAQSAAEASVQDGETTLAAVGFAAEASQAAAAATDGNGGGAAGAVGGTAPIYALGTLDPDAGAATLLGTIAASAEQAGGLVAIGLLGCMADNLEAVSGATMARVTFQTPAPPVQALGGSAGMVVQTFGGNLFAVAAEQLGDATQWYRIAQASGINDPMLTGQVTLTIPNAIQAPSNGIPSPPGVTVL